MILPIFSLMVSTAAAVQWSLPLPADLIAFNSSEGAEMFRNPTTVSTSFYSGFQHLATQQTQTLCSIATSVTLLNAVASDIAPIDPLYDPYGYWTQHNFFNNCTTDVAPAAVVLKSGLTLDQISKMLSCYDVGLTVVKANTTTVDGFRSTAKASLSRGEQIAINFYRTGISETGGGHFSPIMAFCEESDMVLLTDVARYKYPSAWVPVVELFDAMMTIDNVSQDYRGFIILSELSKH